MARQHGFTLLEALVVLAILSVLAGIAFLGMESMVEMATRRAMRSEWEIVSKAIDTYNIQAANAETVPTIAPRRTPSVIEGFQSQGFHEYLRHDTTYHYLWEAEGDSLVVQDTGTTIEGSLRYSSTGFYRYTLGQWVRE